MAAISIEIIHETYVTPSWNCALTEHQQYLVWILGNQGFVHIGALITELLTACIDKNAIDRRQNAYWKIINVAECKTSKKRLLAVEYPILIMYNYPTSKTQTLYKSTDGPAGQTADNQPNPDVFGDLHRTVRELTVQVAWQAGPPIWRRSGSDLDPDPKWQSGKVANTNKPRAAQPSSCRATRHRMNEKSRNEILQSRWGQYTMPEVALASWTTCSAQTSCISEQTEQFSGCPNSATIQHGYQLLALENTHATDVIG